MENIILNKSNSKQHEGSYYSQENTSSKSSNNRFFHTVEEQEGETERIIVSLTGEQINKLTEAREMDKLIYGLNDCEEDETFQKLLDIQKTHNWELIINGDRLASIVDDEIMISSNRLIFIVKDIRVNLDLIDLLIDLEYRNLKAIEILDGRNFGKIHYSKREIARLKDVKNALLRKEQE